MRRNFPPVTISIINYNDKKFIFQAIESAVNQNYPNLEIIITDNNSTDGTKEDIEKKIPEWEEKRKEMAFHPVLTGVCDKAKGNSSKNEKVKELNNNHYQFLNRRQDGVEFIKYVKNLENAGFGRPHNQAIRMARGDFVLLLNSDALLTSNYVENVLKPFEDPRVGAVQGKLWRYDFDKNGLCKSEKDPQLNIIDTAGLLMFKNRRIVCIGQGQSDKGQFEKECEIFGVDGAVPVYRKKALEDVKMPIIKIQNSKFRIQNSLFEYFDEDFFMYKEDVDLAWRLRLAGWKAVYTPRAVAYHGRGSGDSMAKSYLSIIKERRKINKRAKYLSFKHQRLMQIKNDFISLLFIKHFPQFIIKEIGAWFYMAIFERFAWQILKDLHKDIPLFLKKRKIVMDRKRVSVKEMERWFY
jgi:GT2 family glycosyltransferase